MPMRLLLLSIFIVALPLHAADAPRVVATIAPIHSLAAGVMAGVATPELLVSGAASPHSYMLKPSQVRALQGADLVVWSGEGVESFMPRTLRALKEGPRQLKLAAQPGMKLLPAREGGVWGGAHDHDHDHRGHEGGVDGHLWLDPANARVAVSALVVELARIDPPRAERYRRNGDALLMRLDRLDRDIEALLAPVRGVPYLVFHDGYHYFEDRYRLNAVGSISVDPEHKPGAKRLRELGAMIKQRQVRCLFSEPQFSPAAVAAVTAGSGVKSGVLDPLGSRHEPGEGLYFEMMRALGESLRSCLQ